LEPASIDGDQRRGDPTAVPAPGSGPALMVFYRNVDCSLGGIWNPQGYWTPIPSTNYISNNVAGKPFPIQVRGTNNLNILYRGTDDALWSALWYTPDNVSRWWSIGYRYQSQLGGEPFAAQIPNSNTIHVFYPGSNISLYTRWH
jgi:hypothetical protein